MRRAHRDIAYSRYRAYEYVCAFTIHSELLIRTGRSNATHQQTNVKNRQKELNVTETEEEKEQVQFICVV
jgi:hypothetical protein